MEVHIGKLFANTLDVKPIRELLKQKLDDYASANELKDVTHYTRRGWQYKGPNNAAVLNLFDFMLNSIENLYGSCTVKTEDISYKRIEFDIDTSDLAMASSVASTINTYPNIKLAMASSVDSTLKSAYPNFGAICHHIPDPDSPQFCKRCGFNMFFKTR